MDVETFYTVGKALLYIDIGTYTFVLVYAVRNTYKYLIRQRRYKEFHLSVFYSFSVVISVARICYMISFIVQFYGKEGTAIIKLNAIGNSIGFFSKAILGVFQSDAMVELANEIQHAAGVISQEKKKERLGFSKAMAILIAVLLAITMLMQMVFTHQVVY